MGEADKSTGEEVVPTEVSVDDSEVREAGIGVGYYRAPNGLFSPAEETRMRRRDSYALGTRTPLVKVLYLWLLSKEMWETLRA